MERRSLYETIALEVKWGPMALDLGLLAEHIRSKMHRDNLSLRKAAERAGCSPATFSRLLGHNVTGYVPDTATLSAIADWLKMELSDFETDKRPPQASLADVSVHLHALPELASEDAEFIMSVVQLLYDDKRKRNTQEK
jgi:transcriptional regulator with XRE-family HTH domain